MGYLILGYQTIGVLKIFGLKIILIKIVWHASRSQVFLTFSNSHDLTHERESHEIDCRAKYF